jgi:RimJ/RimL family protein N-acetyltransferase
VVPIVCGPCELRVWRMEDIGSLVHFANNRRVWETLRDRFPHPYTSADGRRWLESCVTVDPPTTLAISVDGLAMGGIGVQRGADVHRHTAELGYWLGEPYWGRGIATAAVTHFVPWVMSAHAIERVFANVFETNPASMRVLEKCGFEREGLLRRHILKDGRYLDQVVYARLRTSDDGAGAAGPQAARPAHGA